VHFLQDLEGVPSTLHAEAHEGLALLEHLGPNPHCVKGLGLHSSIAYASEHQLNRESCRRWLILTTVWVMRAMTLAATKLSVFILWYRLRQYSTMIISESPSLPSI
jgi:hypothetical protein